MNTMAEPHRSANELERLGSEIREVRKARNLTLKQLSEVRSLEKVHWNKDMLCEKIIADR